MPSRAESPSARPPAPPRRHPQAGRRCGLMQATRWITQAALAHGHDLVDHVMVRQESSRRTAQRLLAALVASRWLDREGTARRPVYRPGPLRQVVMRYPIPGLQEDLPWSRDVAPCLDLPARLARLAQHAFTELLNNAIDHSGGWFVTVSARQTATHLQLLVSDDGCGLFDRVARSFDIPDPSLAMLELSKGKLTSQPDRHLGQRLFFVARLADVFELHANRHAYQHRAWEAAGWDVGRPMPHEGTSAYLTIALDTEKSLDRVLQAHSMDGQGYAFESTRVPLQLLTGEQVGLESRAQARRVAARLTAFRRADLDFSRIATVGPAFADELFRVYARAHPEVTLRPVGCNAQVQALLQSAG